MKISYIVPCLGACALLMFPSCKTTSADADGYAESALPISEVADGEIPPWLLEDDGSNGAQISAGSHTHSVASRNEFSIPEPTEPIASTGSTSQNQPDLANGQDNTFIENSIGPDIDPLAAVPHPTDHAPIAVATTSSSSTKKTSSSSGKKKTSSSSKKPSKPTMIVYKVRPGDNLSAIAARSNTTVEQIRRDSNLKSSTIYPGQTIKVRYTPKGYKAPAKGSGKGKGSGSSASGKTHTVTSGQTLSGIASRYGVSTRQLMKANGLSDADAKKIRPGQKLKIPAKR